MGKAGWYFNRLKSYIGRPRLILQEKPVILSDDDRCDEPIFLIGAHRSGTTLVRRLFNSHPEIACPPETFFIRYYAEMYQDEMVAAGYDGFGYDREAMRAELARAASRLHEAYRLCQGKRLWADKTPQYVDFLPEIDALFAGKPRYVLIFRHPCDIAFSINQRGWRLNDEPDLFKSSIAYVRAAVDKMLTFEQMHGSRCCRIVYEDLAQDPEAELKRACEALGVEYSSEMLKFSEKSHNYGVEDPVIRGQKGIKISQGAWMGWSQSQIALAQSVFGDRIHQPSFW